LDDLVVKRNREINMVDSMLHLAKTFASQSDVGISGLSIIPAQKCTIDNNQADACLSHDWIAISSDSLSIGLMFGFEDGDQDEFMTLPISSIVQASRDNGSKSQSRNCKVRWMPSMA
jgi:hypothetical protein